MSQSNFESTLPAKTDRYDPADMNNVSTWIKENKLFPNKKKHGVCRLWYALALKFKIERKNVL